MIGHSYLNSIYQQEVEYDMPHDRGSGSTVERGTPNHELDCWGSSSSLLAGQLVPRDTIKEPCSELILISKTRESVQAEVSCLWLCPIEGGCTSIRTLPFS
jgi:hypothetical protein